MVGHRVAGGITLLAGALALAACAGGASPLASTTPTDRLFIQAAATWDLDKDGVITCDEWRSYATQLFRESDRNGDGRLTADEFQRLATTDRLFQQVGLAYFDADRDGQISFAELAEKPNPAFQWLDKDKDCRLTSDEFRVPRGKDNVMSKMPPELEGRTNP